MKKKKDDVIFLKERICNVCDILCKIRVLHIVMEMFYDNVSLYNVARDMIKVLTEKAFDDLKFIIED